MNPSSVLDLLALTVIVVGVGLFTRPGSQGPNLVEQVTKGWSTILKTVSASGG